MLLRKRSKSYEFWLDAERFPPDNVEAAYPATLVKSWNVEKSEFAVPLDPSRSGLGRAPKEMSASMHHAQDRTTTCQVLSACRPCSSLHLRHNPSQLEQ